jgi:hypothetical protein
MTYKVTMGITVSIEADSEEEALAKLDERRAEFDPCNNLDLFDIESVT